MTRIFSLNPILNKFFSSLNFFLLIFSKFFATCGAPTHNLVIKNHMCYQLSQQGGTPILNKFFMSLTILQCYFKWMNDFLYFWLIFEKQFLVGRCLGIPVPRVNSTYRNYVGSNIAQQSKAQTLEAGSLVSDLGSSSPVL